MEGRLTKSSIKLACSLARAFCSIALLSIMATPLVKAADALPASITIGFTPGGNPDDLKKEALAFADALQNKTHLQTNVYVSKDYSSLVEAMKTKKVDFAFFSAMTFVFAENSAGAKVLMKRVRESPFYYSTLLVRQDSGIKSVKQLKGKRLTFVDEKSASGYLYPKVYLKSVGLDPDKDFKSVEFSGHHSNSAQLLREGKTDVIAVYSDDKKASKTAYTKLDNAPKVRSLWVSDPIPNDAFCVRQDFYDQYPRVTHDVMFSMLELQEAPETSLTFKKLLENSSLMLATSRQYEPVRKMVETLGLTVKP